MKSLPTNFRFYAGKHVVRNIQARASVTRHVHIADDMVYNNTGIFILLEQRGGTTVISKLVIYTPHKKIKVSIVTFYFVMTPNYFSVSHPWYKMSSLSSGIILVQPMKSFQAFPVKLCKAAMASPFLSRLDFCLIQTYYILVLQFWIDITYYKSDFNQKLVKR